MTDQTDLTLLLAEAHRAAGERLAAAMRAAGHYAVTPAWGQVIRVLERGPLTLTCLAEAVGAPKQTLSRVVDEMEAAGYLRRRPVPGDRRAKLLALSARGHAAAAEAARASREIEDGIAAETGLVSVRGLRNALGALTSVG